MYVPDSFAEHDRQVLHAFIERHSFATLVSHGATDEAAPEATHLPLLLDHEAAGQGQLLGHFARDNPHWQFADGREVLAVFHGPHAYVSPTWYEERRVVPTWNYVAVHVAGTLRVQHDRVRVLELLRRTVETYEAPLPRPWSLGDSDAEFIDKLVDGVVGFTIEISRIQGKWKLNQNQSLQRRERVVAALQQQPGADQQEIAHLMRLREG
ncbi:MAG: FMN-binding negative transcriptional regulator [Pirellulales bacterium]